MARKDIDDKIKNKLREKLSIFLGLLVQSNYRMSINLFNLI